MPARMRWLASWASLYSGSARRARWNRWWALQPELSRHWMMPRLVSAGAALVALFTWCSVLWPACWSADRSLYVCCSRLRELLFPEPTATRTGKALGRPFCRFLCSSGVGQRAISVEFPHPRLSCHRAALSDACQNAAVVSCRAVRVRREACRVHTEQLPR